MKKFFSLMLAVLLLVSALPFQAFADEAATALFWIEVRVDGEGKQSKQLELPVEPDAATVVAYAKADAEYSAYFAEYTDYEVEELAATSAAINFKTPETPAAPACEHPASKLTLKSNTATCVAAGVKTYECECGETVTEEAAATGNHTRENGVCTVCGDSITGSTMTLTLWADKNKSSCKTITMAEGSVVPNLMAYEPAKKVGYTFDHWETADGKELVAGQNWASSFGTEFFPVYYQDSANDGVSLLNVYVVFYADGIKRSAAPLITGMEFTSSSKSSMFDWLKSDGGINEIRNALAAEGYNKRFTWDNKAIYNYYPSSTETGYAVTKADMDSNGTKNVCIKVNAKAEYMADVFVYIHKEKTATAADMLEMKGYMIGDNVSLSAVKTALKNAGYSYSNIKMYNDAEWTEVVNKENTSPRDSAEVKGVTKLHVYLADASVSSNADTSNPKTGDYITMAVGTMILAAAALVTVTELKKRKMI